MKLIKLDINSGRFFQGLDPFEYLNRRSSFPTFAIGCAKDGEKSDIPAGIVICYLDRTVLVVRWIYVAPGFRGEGISDLLLSAVYEMAQSEGANYIGALLLNEYGKEIICSEAETFFRFQGFDEEVSLGDGKAKLLLSSVEHKDDDTSEQALDSDKLSLFEFSFDLAAYDDEESVVEKRTRLASDILIHAQDVFDCEMLMNPAGGENRNTKVVSLGEITLPMLGEGIKLCSRATPESCFGGLIKDISVAWFDPALSSAVIRKGAVTGLFLVHKEDGKIWPEYLRACGSDSTKQCMLLVQKTAKALRDGYPAETEIVIRCRDNTTREMVDRLFSSKSN